MALPWRKSGAIAEPLIDLADKGHLEKNPLVQQLIRSASITGNETLTRDLMKVLQVQATVELLKDYPFKPPDTETLIGGLGPTNAMLLGHIRDAGIPFLYPYQRLVEHGLVIGASGTGKTNALYAIILQSMQRVPVWIFDRKLDYRHLLRFGTGLTVFHVRNQFRFNVFQPPAGVDPADWSTHVVSVFSKSFGFLGRADSVFRQGVLEEFDARGILKGGTDYPSTLNVRDRIASFSFRPGSRGAHAQETILGRLDACIAECPETYAVSKGFPIEKLADLSFVLELGAINEVHARLLVNIILQGLFLYRLNSGRRNAGVANLAVIDEAMFMATRDYHPELGYPPFAYLQAQAREAGVGTLLASQDARLHDAAFANSRLKMCFALGDGKDVERMSRAMGLTKEQTRYIHKLDRGSAVVKVLGHGAFVLNLPKVRLE